jgi:hypothetical protein
MVLGLEDTLKDMFLGLLGGLMILMLISKGGSTVIQTNPD